MAIREHWPDSMADLISAAEAGDRFYITHEPTDTNSATMGLVTEGIADWPENAEVDKTAAFFPMADGRTLRMDVGGAGDFDCSYVDVSFDGP